MSGDRGSLVERAHRWARHRPWVGDLAIAAVLAGLLAPSSIRAVAREGPGGAWSAVLVLVMVLVHASVVLRRWSPVAFFTSVAVAELVLALAPVMSDPGVTGTVYPATFLPSSLVYLVAAYTVSAYGRRPWPVLSLLVGAVGAVLVTGRVATTPEWSGGAQGVGVGEVLFLLGAMLAAVVAAWALGRVRRAWQDEMDALAERARRAEAERDDRERRAAAEERARIARELHDVVAHSLSVMVRQAEGGRYVSEQDPAAAASALATIADTGRGALTDMRSLLGVLDDQNETPSSMRPQPTLDDLPELVHHVQASGQPVRLRVDGDPQPLGRAAHLAAYRVVQEALTNAVKHAGPGAEVDVVLTWKDSTLRLEVTDNGPPPRRTSDQRPAPGRGLVGMQERLQLVGGTLRAGPAEHGGFAVIGEIPTVTASGRGRR